MTCARCSNPNPEVARFCHRCGHDLRSAGALATGRRSRFAANPGEPLMSFNVVSSIMPYASGSAPQTYRFALMLGLAFPLVAGLFGLLPFAFATAAFVVPVVYTLYLYDVNEWEDQPLPVVLGTMVLSGALALGFTLLWREFLFDDEFELLGNVLSQEIRAKELLVLCLFVPIVSELLKQVGPILLASRPKFDDLIDGLTFGIVSGAAFAAFETLVLNRDLIFNSDNLVESPNSALWASILITAALIKPVVYGTATGIAVAAYSGLGEGYDGFKAPYFRGLLEAIVANILFQLGLYLTGLVEGTAGAVLGMVWGLIVAAALIVRVRYLLHNALLEGALQAAASGSVPRSAVVDTGLCGECEMPLMHQASFCISCGTSVRTLSKLSRSVNSAPGWSPAGTSGGVR